MYKLNIETILYKYIRSAVSAAFPLKIFIYKICLRHFLQQNEKKAKIMYNQKSVSQQYHILLDLRMC